MTTLVEVRATINHAGLAVGQTATVDPELPYIKTCLEAGALVLTGRQVSVPAASPRGAQRPAPQPAGPVEGAAEPTRQRRPRKAPGAQTPPS